MGNEIIKVLNALSEKLGIAINWSSENALPYIEKMAEKAVKLELNTSIMYLLIGLLFCASGILWHKAIERTRKKEEEDRWSDYHGIRVFLYIILTICEILGVIMIMSQMYDIMVCVTFPEKILINMARSMMQ